MSQNPAPVAQLDRVLASEAKGRRFESFRARREDSEITTLSESWVIPRLRRVGHRVAFNRRSEMVSVAPVSVAAAALPEHDRLPQFMP
jgi:hypothetical protein